VLDWLSSAMCALSEERSFLELVEIIKAKGRYYVMSLEHQIEILAHQGKAHCRLNELKDA